MQTKYLHIALSSVACLLSFSSVSFAQDSIIRVAIPSDDFYRAALRDEATIASLTSVISWLEDGSVILLDLRSEHEFKVSHIKGAINLPATELTDESLSKVIPTKESKVVIYCANNLGPSRRVPLTTLAYPAMKQIGYSHVSILDVVYDEKYTVPIEYFTSSDDSPQR